MMDWGAEEERKEGKEAGQAGIAEAGKVGTECYRYKSLRSLTKYFP